MSELCKATFMENILCADAVGRKATRDASIAPDATGRRAVGAMDRNTKGTGNPVAPRAAGDNVSCADARM